MNDDIERLRKFEKQVVMFPSYHYAYTLLQKSVETTLIRGIPSSAMVVGPSGSGKSTLLEIQRDQFDGCHELLTPSKIASIRPAFYCVVPSPVTVKTFNITMLQELGCEQTKGNTAELTFRVLANLESCGVEITQIDEMHNLFNKDSQTSKDVVMSWLIFLANASKRPFVLAGRKACLDLRKESSEFARRFPFVIELKHLEFSEDPNSDYRILLIKLDEYMHRIGDLQSGIHITDPDIAAKLFLATIGNLESIRIVLHSALQNALSHKRQGLMLSDLIEAYSTVDINSLSTNPFQEKLTSCYQIICAHNNEDN